jgi:hypothetical protein
LEAVIGEGGVDLARDGARGAFDLDVGMAGKPAGEFGVDVVVLGGGCGFGGQFVRSDKEGERHFVLGIGEDVGVVSEALEGPAGGRGEGEKTDIVGGGGGDWREGRDRHEAPGVTYSGGHTAGKMIGGRRQRREGGKEKLLAGLSRPGRMEENRG